MDKVDWEKFKVKEAVWNSYTTGEVAQVQTELLTPKGVEEVIEECRRRLFHE